MMSHHIDITCHRHRLMAILLAVVTIAAFHLPMRSEVIDSLYHIYLNAAPNNKAAAADAVLGQLRAKESTDAPEHYRDMGKPSHAETRLHYMMAEHYFVQDLYEKALETSQRAESLLGQVNDPSLKSDVLNMLANVHFRLDNYDESLVALLAAYKIDRQLGDDELVSSDLNTLAAIYLAVQQPQQGIHHIEKAIALERKLKRPDCLAIRLGMASELYLMNGENDKALQAISEAYRLDSIAGRQEKAAIRLSQLGAILEKEGQLDKARAFIEKALRVLEKEQNTYSIAVCHNQLGRIAQRQNRTADAITHFKQALESSIQCGSAKQERNAEHGLWETMREDQPAIAMLHLERYASLSDSLHNRTKSLQMKVMDTTLQDIEQTQANNSARLSHRFILWGGSLVGLMLLLTAIGLFHSWRRNKNALQLQRQSQELHARFLDNIARELHTPLTVIMNAGQQLRETPNANREENERIGEIVVGQGKNMLGMINKLIDINLAKTEQQPRWKDGDIVLYTRLLVNNFGEEARQKGIRLDFTSSVKSLMVRFAPEHVTKIVHNLIANAIVYTPANGHIAVDLSPLDNDKLRLIVSDSGKGIPTNELDQIFEPFTQSENGDDGVATALDLSLTHQLVKALNGEITVTSEPGAGTTFTVILPAPSSSKSSIERQMATFEQSQDSGEGHEIKPLVFIVENDDDVAYLTARQLSQDYHLRFLNDGQDAYDQIEALAPDLIVTSTSLSTINGKELIRKVRSNNELKHIPIIALTEGRSSNERISCLKAGANAVLVKPFDTSELQLVTKQLIEQQAILRNRFVRNTDTVPEQLMSTMNKEDQQFMTKFVDVIYAQMSKHDINMDLAAVAMSISRNQLRTRITAITGMTPMAFVLQLRMNYARRLILSNEDISLKLVASKCGFQSLPHFSNTFKQQFGMSPTKYRKSSDATGSQLSSP